MKTSTKLFIIFTGSLFGIIFAQLSYFPIKRQVKKRHYITLR